jgi:hypothetical protein
MQHYIVSANENVTDKSGLANFIPLQGPTIRKDSPKGCTQVYMYWNWVGGSIN